MKLINEFFNKFIAYVFTIFVALSTLAALRSGNLSLIGIPNWFIFIIIIVTVFTILIVYLKPSKRTLSIGYWLILFLLCIFLFIMQYLIYKYIHPKIGFDLYWFREALNSPKSAAFYFSTYSNNLLLLLMQHKLITQYGLSYINVQQITIFLVDISGLINILLVRLINKKYFKRAVMIHLFWLLLFPMIIIPYSDAWVLPFVSSYIFCFYVVRYCKLKFNIKILFVLLGSITVVGAYYIKPSSIIPVIAIVIMEVLNGMRMGPLYKTSNRKLIVSYILCLFLIITSFLMIKGKINNQKYIEINSSDAMPAIHFVAMGMQGNGGYNQTLVNEMLAQKNKKQREIISQKIIRKTLKKYGFWGYVKFLLMKQGYNTSDGTFGWLKEGNFLTGKYSHSSEMARNIQNFIYPSGKNLPVFNYCAQVFWIVLLLFLLADYSVEDNFKQTLKLSLVGGWVFLLLFEGGRSRYLIQFLPIILTLASISNVNFLIDKLFLKPSFLKTS